MRKNFNAKHIILTAVFFVAVEALFCDTTYKVEKGDTLYSISKKYQLTVAELRAANNLSEKDVLKAGQKLTIPEADIGTAAALSSTKQVETKSNITKTIDYTVVKGDTLYRIAKNNGMSVADLLSLNKLDNNAVIKVGQKLKIAVTTENKTSNSTATSSSTNEKTPSQASNSPSATTTKTPDTRTYGSTVTADVNTKWPVKSPKITQVKGKISGVQLSAKENEDVICIHEGTVMYVGTYRGFGQVVFVQSKTGLIYAYTGLGSVNVRKGEYSVGNAKLGTAGVDSISGKPQITFMVFQNGQPIDPGKAPRS